MQSISFITQPAPTVSPTIVETLDEMYPRVFLQWQPRYLLLDGSTRSDEKWEGRWGIWVELTDTNHPGVRTRIHHVNDGDVWNSEAQCWMRFLQYYNNEDGSFAPIDERLIVGLELADTWANRRFYEDHVEDPFEAEETRRQQAGRQAMAEASRYYRKLENPIVGAHANSGWRWRLGI